jgi:hypothetical protein
MGLAREHRAHEFMLADGADIAKLKTKGVRPYILGLSAFVFIAGFSLMLVKITA